MSMSIEKALDKIADVLTETTDDSNGSIEYSLTVIANALENGGGTGGGGAFTVTFTSEDFGETWTADKTFAECLEAYQSDKVVRAFFLNNGTPTIAMMSGFNTTYDVITDLYFTYTSFYSSEASVPDYYFTYIGFALYSNDTIEYVKNEFTISSASQ